MTFEVFIRSANYVYVFNIPINKYRQGTTMYQYQNKTKTRKPIWNNMNTSMRHIKQLQCYIYVIDNYLT